jgi:hypothetical protein
MPYHWLPPHEAIHTNCPTRPMVTDTRRIGQWENVLTCVPYHVRWVPVTTAWSVLGLRMEERPPAMEGSCEYIKQAAADKRQGVVL